MKTQEAVATCAETMPKDAEMAQSISAEEWAVVSCILTKTPTETWENVATRAGLSVRQLFTYRQSAEVRKAVASYAAILMENELPEILGALCREAKAGSVPAARLYLEYSCGLDSLKEGVKEITEFKTAVFDVIEAESSETAKRLIAELRKLSRRREVRQGPFLGEGPPAEDP